MVQEQNPTERSPRTAVHGGPSLDAAEHPHGRHLAHQFDTPQQQFAAGKLGIWLFLTTEILLFSGLFCAYAVYRSIHPEIFEYAHLYLSKPLGTTNTVVLIFSSFTMASAVWAAQTGRQKWLVGLLAVTLACGFIFVGIKFVEYKAKWQEGLLAGGAYRPTEPPPGAIVPEKTDSPSPAAPAAAAVKTPQPLGGPMEIERSKIAPAAVGPQGISPEWLDKGGLRRSSQCTGPEPNNVQLFFGIYFAMTGLHGVHVLAGMGVIAWILLRAVRGEFGPNHFTPVDFTGLYWHLVDLIWIFLFPLFYLIA
jgi:cytochrome c oxidase subunit III